VERVLSPCNQVDRCHLFVQKYRRPP
jgi:hypothetical protein